MEKLDPTVEKQYLQKEIDVHYKAIEDLSKRIEDIEKLEVRYHNQIIEDFIERAKPIYTRSGIIPDNLLMRYSKRLDLTYDELEKLVIE